MLSHITNQVELWGGVRPVGLDAGPWKYYERVADDVHVHGGARLIRAKADTDISDIPPKISGHDDAYWNALHALNSSGLIYEVVMVLNRDAKKETFADGTDFESIPDDAEPYYELDARSAHGYKLEGEEGIGGATANTVGMLGVKFQYVVSGVHPD